MRSKKSNHLVRNLIIRYVFWGALFYIGIFIVFNRVVFRESSSPVGTLQEKYRFYKNNISKYNLIYVGDSRTYCAFHSDLIDPELNIKSFNVSHWASWFPIQYAFFKDLIPSLPPNVTVVWSIGHQNFFPIHRNINEKIYPIGINNVFEYLRMGYSIGQIWENLYEYNNVSALFDWSRISDRLNKYFNGNDDKEKKNNNLYPQKLYHLIDSLESNPFVHSVFPQINQKKITSLVVLKNNGAYMRIEIDKEFFRNKQREFTQRRQERITTKSNPSEVIKPDPAYWNTFIAILNMFKENRINLIVNEFEEAPHIYFSGEKETWREFMAQNVRKSVQDHGFQYVKVDFDKLNQDDYFDFNHLNSKGIKKFTNMFIQLMKGVPR